MVQLVAIAIAVAAVLGLAWRMYKRNQTYATNWRKNVVRVALISCTGSFLLYVVAMISFQIVIRLPAYHLLNFGQSGVFLLAVFLFSVLGFLGGMFARGLSRVSIMMSGAAMCVLWYFVALGTTV